MVIIDTLTDIRDHMTVLFTTVLFVMVIGILTTQHTGVCISIGKINCITEAMTDDRGHRSTSINIDQTSTMTTTIKNNDRR